MNTQEILRRLAGLRILVVGDLVLDHYIWGDAHRISPEAPVPVVLVDRDSYVAGSAANVAVNVRKLGSSVELVGTVGRDVEGDRLLEVVRAAGVSVEDDCRRAGVPTIVKTRVVVRRQQLCRIDRERPPAEYALSLDSRSLAALRTRVAAVDAVILSDYAKGTLDNEVVAAVLDAARKGGTFVAADPKPVRPLEFREVDLFTPNRAESLQMAGLPDDPQGAFPAESVCAEIHRRFAPRNLVITLGADGMLVSRDGAVRHRIPAYAREVFDVSGAGDTSVAALTTATVAGASLEDAAHFANLAAGVVVEKVGTATATPEEILQFEEMHEG